MKNKIFAFLFTAMVMIETVGINLPNYDLGINSSIQAGAASTVSDEFLRSATDLSGTKVYTGSSDSSNFNMNGRTYYQGLVFSGGSYYNSTNTSSVTFSTEDVTVFSCTIGHIDNTTRNSATVKVYLDDILQEEFTITSNMPLKEYSLDVSNVDLLRFDVVRKTDTAFGFGDVVVDNGTTGNPYTVPTYDSAEDFLTSGYNSVSVSTYNGKSQATSFNMNGRTYYQGLVFSGGSYYNTTNDSRICFNTENVDTFSCTFGHIDNTTRNSATVSVYLDDVLYEEISLTSNMPLEEYTLDLENTKNLLFVVTRKTDAAFAFADISVDGNDPIKKCSVPEYDSAEDFLTSGYNSVSVSTYNGKSQATSFNMNGRTYYQGLVFSGGSYYNTTNDSRICFNTENVDTFSCTFGHIDNTTRNSATVSVYLDDVLYEEISLTSNMPLEEYTLDLEDTKNLLFIVTRKTDAAFAFADISVDGNDPIREYTVPEYDSAEDFLTSGYNSASISTYNGKSQATTFRMNRRTYYQGIMFSGGSYYNTTNTSRVCFNTENIDKFSCVLGHLDNSTRKSATVSVYLDDILYEEFELTGNMVPETYTLDLSDTDNLLFVVSRGSDSAYCFADISVDYYQPIKECVIPEYGSGEELLLDGFAIESATIYDGKSQSKTFDINGTSYDQGILFSGGSNYNTTNTSRFYFNSENISEFSCKIGHIDNSTQKDAEIDVYLDNVLSDTLTLTSEMDVLNYSLDTSNVSNVAFIVTRKGDSQYAMADVQIVAQEKEYIAGDVNMDGKFSVSDVVRLQKWLLAVPNIELADWKAADFCTDGRLNVVDLCLMKRALLS